MLNTIRMIILAVFITIVSAGNLLWAGDLDGGISTHKDESIEDDSKMGDPDVNINFIILDAVSSSKKKKDKDKDKNINKSVVCEAGADCSGPIYNIYDDK